MSLCCDYVVNEWCLLCDVAQSLLNVIQCSNIHTPDLPLTFFHPSLHFFISQMSRLDLLKRRSAVQSEVSSLKADYEGLYAQVRLL